MSARALTVSYLALWLATLTGAALAAAGARLQAVEAPRPRARRRASPPSRELVEHNALVALWPLALVALGWPELPGARAAGDAARSPRSCSPTACSSAPPSASTPQLWRFLPAPAAGVARARDPRRRLADRAHPPRAPQPPARGPGRRRRARRAGRRRRDRDLPDPAVTPRAHSEHAMTTRRFGDQATPRLLARWLPGAACLCASSMAARRSGCNPQGVPLAGGSVPPAACRAAHLAHVRQHPPTTTRKEPDMPATNINRVVLTGNLTRDPELRSTAVGHVGLLAADRVQHAPQEQRQRRVGRQAQLLRRHRLGRPRRKLRPLPRQGPPGRDRRPPGMARMGQRQRQAPGRRDHRRHRPVPRHPRPRRPATARPPRATTSPTASPPA